MSSFYNIKDITKGNASYSGHEAYLNARYQPPDNVPPLKIIYKKNKYNVPIFSRLEVSLSQIAKLFLSPNLTPSQYLVVNDKDGIDGVAVEHLCYIIENKEGLQHSFYTFANAQLNCKVIEKSVTTAEEIPIYFLDKLPQGFYVRLLKEQEAGHLTINYQSLASILATSYTLEEDDLHKGNFGFYLVEKEGKPEAVFFKIDHDLMFVDSIMGFHTRRPFHLLHGPNAFDITTEDLINFPNLINSSNSYWPTKFGYLANPFDNKEYHSFAENIAFASLARNPEFIREKWKAFYRHALIPIELIQEILNACADCTKNSDRAHIALITQAMIARLAHLRAVLASIPEFRNFVISLNDEENERLLKEIIPEGSSLEESIRDAFKKYQKFCSTSSDFEEGDTPLHTAIKLGDYRYEETYRMFGHFSNIKNGQGKTPLDIALERIDSVNEKMDIRKDMRCVMKHLLKYGAQKTESFKQAGIEKEIELYQFKNPYLEQLNPMLNYNNFKLILRNIGENQQFCLKYKKDIAIECIKEWLKLRANHCDLRRDLQQLRNDINGQSSGEESAGVKYIRQLRSKLWIIRQLRGLYGFTTSQITINDIICQTLRTPNESNWCTFFSCRQSDASMPKKPNLHALSYNHT